MVSLDWTLAHHERGPKIYAVTKSYDYVERRTTLFQTVVTAVVSNREWVDGLEVVVQDPKDLKAEAAYLKGAYLLVGGGHYVWEEAIESLVNPRQSEMKQMIEPHFAPAHTHPFEALLNQPLTGTFH